MEIAAAARDPKESTMSKNDNTDLSKVQYRTGTYGSTFDNLADAQADASKRALKDWDDVLVWKTVGYAKSNLQPSATTWVDAQ